MFTDGPHSVYVLSEGRDGLSAVNLAPKAELAATINSDINGTSWGMAASHAGCRLVHVEHFNELSGARSRARELSSWPQPWLVRLIEAGNPGWGDLATPGNFRQWGVPFSGS